MTQACISVPYIYETQDKTHDCPRSDSIPSRVKLIVTRFIDRFAQLTGKESFLSSNVVILAYISINIVPK